MFPVIGIDKDVDARSAPALCSFNLSYILLLLSTYVVSEDSDEKKGDDEQKNNEDYRAPNQETRSSFPYSQRFKSASFRFDFTQICI